MPDPSIALESSTWILVLLMLVGVLVQSAVGFAAGVLIVPVMLWLGYSIPEAQASLLVASIPQNVWGVWSFRDALQIRSMIAPCVTRLAFLPIGVGALIWLESFPMVTLRQIVGGVVLVVTLMFWWIHPKPRSQVAPVWSWIAFPVSGLLQGLVGMGGPPLVLWVQAHDWDTRKSRVFLFFMYAVSALPALGLLIRAFGDRVVAPGLIAAASLPLLIVATKWGLVIGTRLGVARLRRTTHWLLLLVGVAGLLSPWLKP